ncbi:GroES-like protein [Polyplosphaeria fusca]|uniref:GroES-like protein n=1 Tax=Polyplosphaeria fusca TaxID=682080 RepID=A0A9P4RAV4_9PLEO|nr:GroES-like protein [Polyplosphaeria fusca]
MATHKALVLEAFGSPLTLKDVSTPEITPGSALVAPLYSILPSHTNLLLTGAFTHIYPTFPPYTPGYSCVARVLATPPDATKLAVGDLVWVDPMVRGRDDPGAQILRSFYGGGDAASQVLGRGLWRDGTFTEKMLVPLEGAFVLPKTWFEERGMRMVDFALGVYVLLAVGGLESAKVGPGKTIIVAPATGKFSGAAVLVGLAMGARVVAASRSVEKLAKLEAFRGARERLVTVRLTGDEEKDTEALRAASGGNGADVFVDVSPSVIEGAMPVHMKAGIAALRFGGECVLLGGARAKVQMDYMDMMLRNISVRGKFMYEREHVDLFLKLIENGNLGMGVQGGRVDGLKCFSIQDWEKALSEAEGVGGMLGEDVVLMPNQE